MASVALPPTPPPTPPSTSAVSVAPKRGGIHGTFGLFLGGSGLDDNYKLIEACGNYSFASQRRNPKTISSIERDLMMARDSTTSLKFDGKLEPVASSVTEISKERFLINLERRVEEHGQQTFYYVQNADGNVVSLFEHVHTIDLESVTNEHNRRRDPTNVDEEAYDDYEIGDIALSRLVVESLLSSSFYEKIFTRYGHTKDYKRLPGSCLLLMALETCNASVSHDVDGAVATFDLLNLDDFPGEQVSDMTNEALRLIKIMQGGYALPVSTGSRFLKKVSKTSSEEFNRKIFNLLDHVKTMEYKYKVLDPRSIVKDTKYSEFGPIALISTVHQLYGRLITDHDWPALATKLPQSNNASTNDGRYSRPSSRDQERKCFRCGGPHFIQNCPNKNRDRDKRAPPVQPPTKKIKPDSLPAWRYHEPKNLTEPFIDDDNHHWKFCTKCVCRKTGKKGLYHLSHFDHEHKDNFYSQEQANMTTVDVPLGVPTTTTIEPTMSSEEDPLVFQGAWCTPIDSASSAHAFGSPSIERENNGPPIETVTGTAIDTVTPSVLDQFAIDLLINLTGLPWTIDSNGEIYVPREFVPRQDIALRADAPEFVPSVLRAPTVPVVPRQDIVLRAPAVPVLNPDAPSYRLLYSHVDYIPAAQRSYVNPMNIEYLDRALWPTPVNNFLSTPVIESVQDVDELAHLPTPSAFLSALLPANEVCPLSVHPPTIPATQGVLVYDIAESSDETPKQDITNPVIVETNKENDNDDTTGGAISSTIIWICQFILSVMVWFGQTTWKGLSNTLPGIGQTAWNGLRSRNTLPSQMYQVQPHWLQQQLMIFLFWLSMIGWEGLTYFIQDFGRDENDLIPRRQRRKLNKKHTKHHRHTRWGNRLPTLIFLPVAWMAMTNVITFQARAALLSPIEAMRHQIFKYGESAYHRIMRLDEMVTLNVDTFVQFNKLKGEDFLAICLPSSLQHDECETNSDTSVECVCSSDTSNIEISKTDAHAGSAYTAELDSMTTDPLAGSPYTTEVDSMNSHQANGPTIVTNSDNEQHRTLVGKFDGPCAFMHFSTEARHPVIFDTGASLAITHDKLDFSGPITLPKTDLRLGGMANGLKIEGIGPVTWTFSNGAEAPITVTGMSYYVPQAKARLLSPQRLCNATTGTIAGRFEGDNHSFRLHFPGQPPLVIEYDERNSLPIGYASFHDNSHTDIDAPQVNLAILSDENQNMTGGQKLLLQWHYRFGHLNLPAIQRIMRAVPFLTVGFESASKCDTASMKCAICEYAKGHRRARQQVHQVPNEAKIGALKVEHLKPGANVSVDHFESRILGRTFDSFGKASSAMYKGGCIFVDHCSGYLHVEHQLGFSAVESIRAKQAFEQLSMHSGVVIASYLTDSGAFKANAFVQHIREHSQRIHYCGANAHHKNGVAERAVKSVSNMARALILHASTHWKDGIDSSLWPMAVTYATHLYNHLPNAQGLCPADIFTGSTVPRHRLKDIHVWGCPIYVLDPHLQSGQKLPRWEPRSRRGVFMGFSSLHSSEVPLVLNLQTGSITPQYHVVFDDLFSTVSSIEREIDPPANWADLCLENTTYIPVESSSESTSPDVSSSVPFLDLEWLSPDDQQLATRATTRHDTIRQTMVPDTSTPTTQSSSVLTAPMRPTYTHVTTTPAVIPLAPTYAQVTAIPPASVSPSTAPPLSTPTPSLATAPLPAPVEKTIPSAPLLPNVSHGRPPVAGTSRSGRPLKKVTRYIEEAYLSSVPYSSLDMNGQHAQLAYLAELYTCSDTGDVNITDPRVYAAKLRGSDADMPTFQQAMNGTEASEYISAMQLEIQTLIGQRTWDTVDRPMHKSVLKGTWAFKLKRLPDGTPYRYKARFCARGDMQTEGVDFFETYAPVVQWSTIRLLLSTVLTEGWTTRQVDYTNAFAQAELHEEVYVECPRLFAPKSGLAKVLRLRKSLYGLRQAPRTFFEKLRSGLLERGWSQSLIDPCLFMKSGMMCVVYVDDTIFAAANLADIEREITSLGISTDAQTHTFALRNEGEVSAFLGIQIEKKKNNEFLLTQTGLIDKVLAVTKMSECNGCDTPATIDPLHADKDGEPFDEEWAYDGVIGMLMYLAGNTRPDIAYAVHQAARFTHGARNSHAAGVKRILRYLQRTRKEGLYLKPSADLRVDCHVDSDFGGLFSVEDKQNPVCVKSRSGYVITYRDAPLMWVSKMQSQVALSTMEAEYIALSQSMRDLIPIREVLKEIMTQVFELEPKITYHSHSKAFEDTIGTTPHVIPQSTVYEDNDACLKFARMPKLTPRTKHIGMPYHWFRTQVERLEIHIERVDTLNQLGDQFTKGLPPEPFKVARKRLMGW